MRTVLLLIAATLTLFLAGCGAEEPAMRPDTLVRIADSEIRGLDPQLHSDLASLRVARDQFVGLTRFDASGEAVPGLANRWTTSPDGLAWRFDLAKGKTFSDGTAISAKLFERVWERLNDPATASPHSTLFGAVADVRASTASTVDIHLSRPFPELPALLAHPAMAALPMHRIAAAGDRWTADRPMVTSGAYRLADWRLNDRLVLESNPAWQGDAPGFARIAWRPVDDSLAAMRLFLGGRADIVGDYPDSRTAWLQEQRPGEVHSAPYLGSYYFAFNTRKPPFNNARVRHALSITVDREWIAENLSETGNPPAWGVVPPALYAGKPSRPEWSRWPRTKREKAARRLLEEAGFGPGHPLRFDMRINSSAEHRRIAVALAAMWRPLGVEAHILNSEATLHFASLRRGDFTLARSGWIGDLPAASNFLDVHRADAGAVNYSGYDSGEYDRLLDSAANLPDPERRSAAMQRAEAVLVADAPILPLYYYVSRNLVSTRVGGWQDNASNIHPSATLFPAQEKAVVQRDTP